MVNTKYILPENLNEWKQNLFLPQQNFDVLCLQAYEYQRANNGLYNQFCTHLIGNRQVQAVAEIPFLPISFFKKEKILSVKSEPKIVFESSGTTSAEKSKHYVADLALYESSFLHTFNQFYGKPEEYCILGLLPSYLEQGKSSLVYMVDKLVSLSKENGSGFFLHNQKELADQLLYNESCGKKTILFGVTYALLDFAEAFPMPLQHTIIIETGGMKGRKKELTKSEVHEILLEAFHLEHVHAEYGMTELLSQAYSAGNNIYRAAQTMEVCLRMQDDPLQIIRNVNEPKTRSGLVNIIDLCNIDSCCFIATDDVGKFHADKSFEILGRHDSADLRGCSLLTA